MTADEYLAAARSYMGVPWRHQGRTRSGIDCVGLVVMAARDIGIPAPLDASYGRIQNYRQARRYLDQFCTRAGHAMPGDIVLFKNSQSLHMAIVTMAENGTVRRVIQALGPSGKVVETGLNFAPLMLWRAKAWQ